MITDGNPREINDSLFDKCACGKLKHVNEEYCNDCVEQAFNFEEGP